MFRVFLFLPLLLTAASAFSAPYHLLKEIPVGGEGGWDYLSCEATAHRLYVTHATKIIVIDTEKDAIVGEVADTPGVHGFALAPELGLGFSSNGKEAKASIVDLKTLKTIAKVDTGEDPDCILYASGKHEVYTFNGHSQTATIFDAKTGHVTATIPLPGDPEFAAYDPSTEMVYDNIVDKNEVVAIDAKSHRLVNTWSLFDAYRLFFEPDPRAAIIIKGGPPSQPTSMAIDPERHYLFIGCRSGVTLLLDATSGKLRSTDIGYHRVDATVYDPSTKFVISSSGDGNTTISKLDDSGRLNFVQLLHTPDGARTMSLDPQSHKIYLATAKFEPLPPNSPPGTRPKIIPDTFKILVYGM